MPFASIPEAIDDIRAGRIPAQRSGEASALPDAAPTPART